MRQLINGQTFIFEDEEFEKPTIQAAAKESQPKFHHFGTIDGQTFIVEDEEVMPSREQLLQSENSKVNQKTNFF